MKYSTAISMAVVAVGVQSQGVPAGSLVPKEPAPAGCMTTAPGKYEVQVVKLSTPAKRSLEKRIVCDPSSNALIMTLNNGVLNDSKGRVGAIVHNRQFQFDGPPAQTGSIYTGGFSICSNGSLAIGGSTQFYQCLSGGFYNLYDQNVAPQCAPVQLLTYMCDGAGAGTGASQASDGQIQASSATSVVNQQSDGQPTAPPATVISQISDGQIQGPTAPAVVSQIGDGQVQATAASNATISSAQPTAPIVTGAAASLVGSGAVVGAVAIAAFFL